MDADDPRLAMKLDGDTVELQPSATTTAKTLAFADMAAPATLNKTLEGLPTDRPSQPTSEPSTSESPPAREPSERPGRLSIAPRTGFVATTPTRPIVTHVAAFGLGVATTLLVGSTLGPAKSANQPTPEGNHSVSISSPPEPPARAAPIRTRSRLVREPKRPRAQRPPKRRPRAPIAPPTSRPPASPPRPGPRTSALETATPPRPLRSHATSSHAAHCPRPVRIAKTPTSLTTASNARRQATRHPWRIDHSAPEGITTPRPAATLPRPGRPHRGRR